MRNTANDYSVLYLMQEIVDLDSQEVARVVEQADASAEEELVQLRQERTRHLTERHRVLRLLQRQQEVIARQESELRTRRNDERPRELVEEPVWEDLGPLVPTPAVADRPRQPAFDGAWQQLRQQQKHGQQQQHMAADVRVSSND